MPLAELEAAIEPGASLVIDSSAILAYLDGTGSVSALAAIVFDEFVRTGRNAAAVSAVSVTEVLVRPLRAGSSSAAGTVEAFLLRSPNLSIAPVTYDIAREAAAIRATTALRTPDATILATALILGSPIVVANDSRWLAAIVRARLPVRLCHLDAFR
jgi:predicted nucleic acid-binding protein